MPWPHPSVQSSCGKDPHCRPMQSHPEGGTLTHRRQKQPNKGSIKTLTSCSSRTSKSCQVKVSKVTRMCKGVIWFWLSVEAEFQLTHIFALKHFENNKLVMDLFWGKQNKTKLWTKAGAKNLGFVPCDLLNPRSGPLLRPSAMRGVEQQPWRDLALDPCSVRYFSVLGHKTFSPFGSLFPHPLPKDNTS